MEDRGDEKEHDVATGWRKDCENTHCFDGMRIPYIPFNLATQACSSVFAVRDRCTEYMAMGAMNSCKKSNMIEKTNRIDVGKLLEHLPHA